MTNYLTKMKFPLLPLLILLASCCATSDIPRYFEKNGRYEGYLIGVGVFKIYPHATFPILFWDRDGNNEPDCYCVFNDHKVGLDELMVFRRNNNVVKGWFVIKSGFCTEYELRGFNWERFGQSYLPGTNIMVSNINNF